MKQGKNKRNNTQNLKEYIQQLAQTGIKELTDIVFPPACPVCGGVLGFERADEDKSVRIVTTDLNISANRAA